MLSLHITVHSQCVSVGLRQMDSTSEDGGEAHTRKQSFSEVSHCFDCCLQVAMKNSLL